MTHKKTALIMILFAIILSGCSAIPEMLSPWLDWPPSEGTEPPTPTATTVVETAVPTHTLPAETPIVEPLPTDAVSPPDGDFTYTLQAGNPFYLPNFNHPDADCNWMGIAGQVFGPDGESLLGVTIEVGDLGAGDSAVFSGITGEVQAYGLGGYEIKLADAPLATSANNAITNRTSLTNPENEPVEINPDKPIHRSKKKNVRWILTSIPAIRPSSHDHFFSFILFSFLILTSIIC